ncbi:MAG: SurA N-terminal domain-containing protein [Myxococcota bacterium]|nr:SurA N-terminal domain-containing protein [Myxococcota bacterium]
MIAPWLALVVGLSGASTGFAQRGGADSGRAEARLDDEGWEVLERVVAVVDDDPVFLSELRRRAAPFLAQAARARSIVEREAAIDVVYRQVLEQLIDERLVERAAVRMQLSVTAADVDRAIENVRRQSELDETQFWQAIAAQGMTRGQYRELIRRQLLSFRVLNQRARGRVDVDEAAVRARYREMARRAHRGVCVQAYDVFFAYPPGADATTVARVRAEAAEAARTLTPQTVAQHPNAVDLGRICEGAVREELATALATTPVGAASDPVAVPEGVHVLFVRERSGGNSEIGSYEQMRPQIARELLEEAMQRMERQLRDELRRGAVIERRL